MSNSFIKKVEGINLLGGNFVGEIEFKNGLNVIGGENGTGKTKLLEYIKTGTKTFEGTPTSKLAYFNPKRNAEKNTIDHFVQKLRREGTSQEKLAATLLSQGINDGSFISYPSITELFITGYEHVVDGDEDKGKKTAIIEIVNDFNDVLKKIFPNYSFTADWVDRKLNFQLEKDGCPPCQMRDLSCGESEVFSLIFSIYNSRDSVDIFLIDEPEIHLNWALELGLFKFLEWMCSKYQKQVIVTTHSRVIFLKDFYSKTQFLAWEDSKVVVKNEPPEDSRKSLIAESIDFVTGLDYHENTFFVEDERHVVVVKALAAELDKDVGVVKLKDKGQVENFCRATNAASSHSLFFMRDGDNENVADDLSSDQRFIHLKKYSVENYFLDLPILTLIATNGKSEEDIKQLIEEKVRDVQHDSKNLVYKKIAESNPNLLWGDVMDTFRAKQIMEEVYRAVGFTDFIAFTTAYIRKTKEDEKLDAVFGEITGKMNSL